MNPPKVTYTSIQPGNAGTRETLVIMRNLAHKAARQPFFRQFAFMFKNASEVDNTLRKHYAYVDEAVETLIAPEYNLYYFLHHNVFIGDCDDIAMLYGAIFNTLGIHSRFVAMRTEPNNTEFLHVVVEAFEDRRWKRFDPTVTPSTPETDYGQMIEYL